MSTIRKTISISKKDEKLQKVIENVPSYEVSHVIRQLMYDGLKYRALVKNGNINDDNVVLTLGTIEKEAKNEVKTPKKVEKVEEYSDFTEEIDINTVKLEEIEEKEEDLEDLLLENS